MPARRMIVAYVAWMAVLAVVFVYGRPAQESVRALAGLSASAAIVFGVRQYRPARAWPWLALAGAVPLSAAGWIIYDHLSGDSGTLGSGAEILYVVFIVMSALMIGGLIGLSRPADRDLTALIDIAILLLGAGLLALVLVAVPYAITPDLPGIQAAGRILFVARDVLLLAAVVHLATSVRWNSSVALLVGGVAVLLTYGTLLRVGTIRGVALQGTAVELGGLLFAAALGAAALLPTMAALGAPGAAPHRSVPLRLGLLTAASVLPFSLVLATAYQPSHPWYEPLVATVATIMLALVLAQLVAVGLRLRNQREGERALREAVADIVAARDLDGVTETLRGVVPKLLPPRAGGRLRALAGDATDQASPASGVPRGDFVPTSDLPAAIGRQLGGGQVLAYRLCPAAMTATGRPLTLYVGGDRTALARVRPRLDVLASQAYLVLDRIRLSQEIVRRATEEYVGALAQTSGDVILIVDDDDRITLAGPTADSIFGTEDLVGVWLPVFVDEAERPAVLDLLKRTRSGEALHPRRGLVAATERAGGAAVAPADALPVTPAPVQPIERVNVADWAVRRGDGSLTRVEVACRRVTAADPSVRGLVVDLRDVSEQRRLEDELTERAMHDSVTGLASRQLFRDRLRQAVDTSAEHRSLAGVVILDIDDFKLINSQLGHEHGDTVLRTVGQRLSESLPPDAMAARLGGDEFAVVVPDAFGPAAVDEIGARMLAAIARPIPVENRVVTCTASAGIATTAEVSTAVDLSRCADLSLQTAKNEGRGQSRHYDTTMRSAVLDRLELRSSLERALDERALTLEYQPIVDLNTGITAGFEALLRWQHPTRGQLSPGAFIDVAEQSGLIVPIGDWILATAMREARRWERVAVGAPPYVGVNVSPPQFGSPGFFGRIRQQLTETGLAASRLHLEITESLLIHDDDRTRNELQRLRRLGIQIAIDDFGTGYSALSYLGHVPLDIVKLDRSFVRGMTSADQQSELVEGIVRLAEILRLAVVAEGIETVEEKAMATRVGCRYGQGFLFARPMPADAVLAWLAGERDGARDVAVSGGRRPGRGD